MAQFYYFGSKQDRYTLLAEVFSSGRFRLVPSVSFGRNTPHVFREITPALKEYLSTAQRDFFITGDFTEQMLSYRTKATPEGPLCIIQPSHSGAHLVLAMPGCEHRDGIYHLGPGWVLLPRSFLNAVGRVVKPSKATREAYATLLGMVKRLTKPWNVNRNCRLGSEAMTMLESGNALILFRDYWLDNQGRRIKRVRCGSEALSAAERERVEVAISRLSQQGFPSRPIPGR